MDINVESLSHVSVGVLGDVMLDCYVTGHVSRVSPEAPVLVVDVDDERSVLGGAGNVCRNIRDFGSGSILMGIIGEDAHGEKLKKYLEKDCERLIVDSSRMTTVKTRLMANRQQIVRMDRELTESIHGEVEEKLICSISENWRNCDLLIVSDYAKGVLTPRVVSTLRDIVLQGGRVAVDPHPKNPLDWSGMSVIKPNLIELESFTGIDVFMEREERPEESESFMRAVAKFEKKFSPEHLLITLSERGMYYRHRNGDSYWVPAKTAEVYDVSGAGDTAISYFSLAIAGGWSGRDATEFANIASSLVVRKLGTSSLRRDEIENAWKEHKVNR